MKYSNSRLSKSDRELLEKYQNKVESLFDQQNLKRQGQQKETLGDFLADLVLFLFLGVLLFVVLVASAVLF